MAAVQVLNKKKRKKIDWKRTFFIVGMLAFPLIQFAIFFIYVNIDSVLMTFRGYNYGSEEYIWTTKNYTHFFHDLTEPPYVLRTAFLNSLFFGLNDLVLVLISLVLAYFFFKKIPGRHFFRVIFFLPSIISIVVYTMAYSFMFDYDFGPINKLIELFGGTPPSWLGDKTTARFLVASYCLWVGTGYNILIFGGAMANINSEVMEYAKLDGVGMFRELFQIVLPMIWPTLSVAFLSSITTVFTLFLQVQLLTFSDTANAPRTIAFIINNTVAGNQEYAATIGICFTIAAIPMILIVRKAIDLIGKKFGY